MIRSAPGILATTLILAASATPAVAQCGGESLCSCMLELSNAVEGKPVDVERLTAGLGQPVRGMFTRGGSQNIPVVCNAARYYADHDPSWFLDYFRVQVDPEPPGFLGTEVLSPLYMQSVLGAVLATRAHAVDRGHASLVAAADHWLKATWALLALSTAPAPIAGGTLVQHDTVEAVEPNRAYTAGVSVPVAGMRANRDGQAGMNSLLHPFMSLALDWRPRRYTADLRLSPGFYRGLMIGAVSLGFRIDGDGRVGLDGYSPPPERLGLTDGEQQTLARFVDSGGTQGLSQVLAMLGDRRPSCEMTFLRTTEGLTSWFGTSKRAQRICNRNKGPLIATRYDADTRHVTWLHPTEKVNPAESGQSFRRDDQICARLEDGTERCIDIVGGDTIYEVAWTRKDGAVVVDGSARASADLGLGSDDADAPPEDDLGVPTEPIVAEPIPLDPPEPEPPIVIPNMQVVGPGVDGTQEGAEPGAGEPPLLDDVPQPDAAPPSDGAPRIEPPRRPVELPTAFHIEGSAEGGEAQGLSTKCLLDLDLEIVAPVGSGDGMAEYAGTADGRITKSVLDGDTEVLSYAVDVNSQELLARVWSDGSIELLIPGHLDSDNGFLRELGRFEGTAANDGSVNGTWSCAPFDMEPDASVVDISVTASGSWQLDTL